MNSQRVNQQNQNSKGGVFYSLINVQKLLEVAVYSSNDPNILVFIMSLHELGDCCLPDIKTDYCEQCLCIEGSTTTALNPGTTTQSGFETTLITECNVNTGDGYCDDDLNTPTCNYDGGNSIQPSCVKYVKSAAMSFLTCRGLLFG